MNLATPFLVLIHSLTGTVLQPSSAYLLVSHGSRDPRPQVAIERLAQLVQQKATTLVGTAFLECAPIPLHEQIQQFVQAATTQGIAHIQIVPMFLLPGVHVMEDIPEQISLAKLSTSHSPTTIAVSPHIGSHPGLKTLLADRLAALSAEACILLSHGSRRAGGNHPVEDLAAELGVVPAYWLVAPSLESRLQEISQAGYQEVAILPYFLFSGGLTDAITKTVEQLADQFPKLRLTLASPLEASDELAAILLDFIVQSGS